jgi:SAM-dependent methyltransferase
MRKASDEQRKRAVAQQMTLLRPYLEKSATFLEIGPGDCSLSLELTRHVKCVYAVDVATEIHKGLIVPENFRLFLSDGRDVPVPRSSVDLAYSNQLMEHLHPDDALTQLRGVYEALAPNGKYICVTPNRLTGPHDVSRGFDKVATGFHLKEYTIAELRQLFKDVGFSDVSHIVTVKGRHFHNLSMVARAVETFHSVTSLPVLTPGLLRIKIVGTK